MYFFLHSSCIYNLHIKKYTYQKCTAWWIFTNWTPSCDQHPEQEATYYHHPKSPFHALSWWLVPTPHTPRTWSLFLHQWNHWCKIFFSLKKFSLVYVNCTKGFPCGVSTPHTFVVVLLLVLSFMKLSTLFCLVFFPYFHCCVIFHYMNIPVYPTAFG
jgi:hypothetical protein